MDLREFKHLKGPRWDQVKPEHRRYPYLASPKLDGFRCTVLNGVPLTSGLKPFPNLYVQECLRGRALEGLDGELVVGDPTDGLSCNATSSGVTRIQGRPEFTFWVFDRVPLTPSERDLPFEYRLQLAQEQIDKSGRLMHVAFLKHELTTSEIGLMAYEQGWVEDGYEGLIARHPRGIYKFGRSSPKEGLLIKLKRYRDAEAEIIGIYEEKSNQNEEVTDSVTGRRSRPGGTTGHITKGRLGGFLMRDLKTGVEFRCGSGLKAHEREEWWKPGKAPIGAIATYKSMPFGEKDKPRQPIFKRLRDPIDMDRELSNLAKKPIQGNLL